MIELPVFSVQVWQMDMPCRANQVAVQHLKSLQHLQRWQCLLPEAMNIAAFTRLYASVASRADRSVGFKLITNSVSLEQLHLRRTQFKREVTKIKRTVARAMAS